MNRSLIIITRHFSLTTARSTKPWMMRHVLDPYVRRSVKENYRARSAFKLIEINEKHKFLEAGQCVIDMGAAPGAWSQVLVKHVNPRITSSKNETDSSKYQTNMDAKCGSVIALDRLPIFPIPGVHIIDHWNLSDETENDCRKKLDELLSRLKLTKVDGVLSDMCPNVTGNRSIDHIAIVDLQRKAFDFARSLLKENGFFLCKLFQGQEQFQTMRSYLESRFEVVHHVKPSASREESPEVYLLAMKYLPKETKEKNLSEFEKMLEEARRVRTKPKKIK